MFDGLDPRDADGRERDAADPRDAEPIDPRDVFTQGLDLPRGLERERVHARRSRLSAARVRGAHARHDRRVSRGAGGRSPR